VFVQSEAGRSRRREVRASLSAEREPRFNARNSVAESVNQQLERSHKCQKGKVAKCPALADMTINSTND
jgi:hypothetical protein